MEFIEYEIKAATLCLGERVKGALYRPCDMHTIRYSAITGALREYWGVSGLHAAGWLVEDGVHNRVEHLVYSPQDRTAGRSKVPLTVQIVTDVLGRVYVRRGDWERAAAADHQESFEISLGALKSRGFGRCRLRRIGVVASGAPVQGRLRTRVPREVLAEFDVREFPDRAVYGYLFRPTSESSGVYVLSLFEGSVVKGPEVLVDREVRHG